MRHHMTPEGPVPFTPEEEAEWNAREATAEAEAIESQWRAIRSDRNARLADCDWTQLSDAPLTNVQAAAWAVYRQALRDITVQSDPFNITWPQEPE